MVNIFFVFWRRFSIFFITATILYCYASLPDSIAVSHFEDGNPKDFIGKQTFFYWTTGIIFLFNILTSLLKKAILKLNFDPFFPNSAWVQEPEALKTLLSSWFDAFTAVINTFLVFVILGLNNINANKNKALDFNYNYLILFGAFLLVVLIFVLPLKLLYSSPKSTDI